MSKWLEPSVLCGQVVSAEAEPNECELVLTYSDGRRLMVQIIGRSFDIEALGISLEDAKSPAK